MLLLCCCSRRVDGADQMKSEREEEGQKRREEGKEKKEKFEKGDVSFGLLVVPQCDQDAGFKKEVDPLHPSSRSHRSSQSITSTHIINHINVYDQH